VLLLVVGVKTMQHWDRIFAKVLLLLVFAAELIVPINMALTQAASVHACEVTSSTLHACHVLCDKMLNVHIGKKNTISCFYLLQVLSEKTPMLTSFCIL
jgi:hypothetical protein